MLEYEEEKDTSGSRTGLFQQEHTNDRIQAVFLVNFILMLNPIFLFVVRRAVDRSSSIVHIVGSSFCPFSTALHPMRADEYCDWNQANKADNHAPENNVCDDFIDYLYCGHLAVAIEERK